MAELDNALFSEQELEDLKGGLFSGAEEKGPVTVLGITFANDDERRAYFREELRKKLPELKLIEGFPIGSDDDIINLSDPPFYTACPNPWIKDIISIWENEKSDLIKTGIRAEKIISEPYATDVSEGKNNSIYMAHAYHTKVPHTAVMRYILHYTEPGDIIFDGFCGTGMTGVAANMCASKEDVAALNEPDSKVGARHCLCSDLSPIASLISASYNLKFNSIDFTRKANRVLSIVEKELGWLYEINVNGGLAKVTSTVWSDIVTCPHCGSKITLWDALVDETKSSMRDSFTCPSCGMACTKKETSKSKRTIFDPILNLAIEQSEKIPVRFDYVQNGRRGSISAMSIDEYSVDYEKAMKYISQASIPSDRMPEGDEARRNDKDGLTHVHHFYTLRSVLYLSRVYELCKNDPSLLAWFTSTLLSTSVMNKFRFSGTGINSGTLYIPSINWEFSPYNTLKRKLQAFAQTEYQGRGNSVISIMSATALSTIPDNCVDYMFIDPPFGANLMYSELNYLWENWIRVKTETTDEAIVNNTQNKGLFEYQTLMNLSLKEFYRILKPGKWLTMEFSNTSAAVWNSIQNALQGVGFVVANVAGLDKKQGSFKAVTTPTAVKQDLVITCFKPTSGFSQKFETSCTSQSGVWDFIEEYIQHLPVHIKKDNSTTAIVERSPKILFDRLISYYVKHGLPVPIDAQDFQEGLRERYIDRDGMIFSSAQAIEYDAKKKETSDFIPMGLIVSNEADGIEWLKIHLDKPKTYAEIQPDWMQAINGVRKNDILPELDILLEENFIQEEDGKWRLPNIQDDVDKFKLRTKALLKEFKLYVEQASKPKAKIKEVRVEAVRAGFKQCYIDKDFQTIVTVGDKIPQNLLEEDEILLQFYDIAVNHV